MKKAVIKCIITGLCICSMLNAGIPVMASNIEKEDTENELGNYSEYSMENQDIISIDEIGNVFKVEEQSDGVIQESEGEFGVASGEKIVNFRANSSGVPVKDTTVYTEYGTGASGYLYGGAGADAAYLGMENGKVKFLQAGIVGIVDASKVQVVNLSSVKSFSNYYATGSRIIHRICMDMTTGGYGGSVDIGPQQSYMRSGTTYYSYDGHYFYTTYGTMLKDYVNNTRINSINPTKPYYNYFQYLPLRGSSNYSAAEMTTIINNSTASVDSKMYGKGSTFVNKQNTYGVNALLMVGVGAIESAWGTSSIAKSKNNLFGLNAVDGSAGNSADKFSSVDACIKDFAETYMSKRYLRAGYMYYNGGFLGDKASGINVSYASDPYWGEKIAGVVWALDNANGKKDQYFYTLGIKDSIATSHTTLNMRKEASISSQSLYTTGTRSNYAFLILGNSNEFYKVQSDPVLSSGNTQADKESGKYNASSMYVYVSEEYVSVVSDGKPAGPDTSKTGVSYSTHVQGYGWQDYCDNGTISGTESEAKRAEAIKIQIVNPEYGGSVQYRSHIQSDGWQDWVSDNQVSGTEGQRKRMEAIQVRMTGEVSEHYDIYYRVHVQTYGWLDWAKNGDTAGTTDGAKRLEAIQIVLSERGEAPPGNNQNAYIQPLVQYRAHVQTYGWQDYLWGGGLSGTSGIAKRLEAVQIKLKNQKYHGNIKYKVHVQTYGWQDWKSADVIAGTTGEAKRLEAIQIELTEEMSEYYDIYYRAHVQSFGWLDWAKNGEMAGTTGCAKRMESIQIVLIKKGEQAPGSTNRPFVNK